MKIPIPDDWSGDWSCIQIVWPDSVIWRAILLGMIDQMSAGRLWDERSGSIHAIQAVGREIWRRNIELTPCSGETLPMPTPEQVILYGIGDDDDCEECDDMGCSPCIRWNEGILETLVCGEWVAVPGGGGSTPPIETEAGDIGDPNTPQPNDAEDVDIDVKCRAAWALAAAMWRVHARIIDYVDDVTSILNIGNLVASDLPEYTLTKYHISVAAGNIILATATIDLDLMFGVESTYVADLAAWLVKFMPTRYSLSRAQYEALALGLLGYSFHEGLELNLGQFVEGDYWRQIWWALGPGTVNDIMAQSRTLPASEFDCDERPVYTQEPPVPPGDGAWFSGLITKTAGTGLLAITAMSSNMRKITIRWMVDAPGAQFTSIEFLAALVVPVNLTSITFKLTGEYPLADWHAEPYNRWLNPHIPALAGVTGDNPVAGVQDATGSVWVVGFDSGKPTAYEAGASNSARFLPADTRDLGDTAVFDIEIIAWA